MRILIAPNAFKGSLTAEQVAEVVSRAFSQADSGFECFSLPVADGGDGTAHVLAQGLNAKRIDVEVQDPLGRPMMAPLYLTEKKTALIELADAAGIRLLSVRERAPLQTHTYGVGQLMRAAMDNGCRKIILGVGGSATLDMGIGLLRALGVRFLGANGYEVVGGGGAIERIVKIDVSKMDPRLSEIEIQVACDVDNQLLGKNGAARVFGPQKGANPFQVELLERNHRKLTDIVKNTLGEDMASYPFGGAAGGVSATLKAICNAALLPGAQLVLDTLDFNSHLERCHWVITGEGCIDSQSRHGKAPFVVAQRAQKAGKKVIALAGSYEKITDSPFDAVFSIVPGPISLDESMRNASVQLFALSHELAKLIKLLWKE